MDNKAFFKLSYGLYIISTKSGNKFNAQIANSVFQISSNPKTLAISINKENLTYEYLLKNKSFTVSVLTVDSPMEFIGKLGFKSGRNTDKFKGLNYKIGNNNDPIILDYCNSYFECNIINTIDVFTHTVFIAEIINAEIINDSKTMTYDYYHKVKKGSSPKSAPTYIEPININPNKNETKNGVISMSKYSCKICGYVYDPEKGDPDNGIAPGTAFEDLPDVWVCPLCGAGKEEFEKEI